MSLVDLVEIGGMLAGVSVMVYGLNELKNQYVNWEKRVEEKYPDKIDSIKKRNSNY